MDEQQILDKVNYFLQAISGVITPADKYRASIIPIQTVDVDGVLTDQAKEGIVTIFSFNNEDLERISNYFNKITSYVLSGNSLETFIDQELEKLDGVV
jgi:hypothetical protein